MTEGYKGHLAGSRKGDVHKAFDDGGLPEAMKVGAQLKLSPLTIKSWVAAWSGTRTMKPKAALPVTPPQEFDLQAWKERVMRDVEYFAVVPNMPNVKGRTQHDKLKEAVKQATKKKLDVIWAVNANGKVAPLNREDWKRYA